MLFKILHSCLLLAALYINTVHLASTDNQENGEFKCLFPDGLFADPATCRRFYICAAGHPYLQMCPPSLYFDDVKKFCTRKDKEYTCGPVELTTAVPTTPDPLVVSKCNTSQCLLPNCFCSSDGTQIPGGLEPEQTPQMVFLTFDGALNYINYEQYQNVLNETRKNPNGCPIKATFFTAHEYSSYFFVQKLYSDGHEFGVNSVSHRQPEDWWSTASYEDWTEEMVGQREILIKFANLSRDSVLGSRAPFLKPGGNNMATMLFDYNFAYDSSIAVPQVKTPIWPYTLDYGIPHRCLTKNCPSHSFPGMWEIPLNTMFSEEGISNQCVLADQCVLPSDEKLVFDFLNENFLRHYKTNRAPFGLFFYVNWFNDKVKVKALNEFIDHLLNTYQDVWFVTMQQALQWMSNPVPINEVTKNYVPWACEKRQPSCNIPHTCTLPFSKDRSYDMRYMQTCEKCPAYYPWVGNFEGKYVGRKIVELTEGNENEALKKK
ncbi:chitin deacetylase 7-like [Tachypleus tridentatus]|uniref:chitin deacetylase 7-like n=1 Tax=Tachypleus tridentatus TaxID=6853 RepID=UPI003FCFB0EA